MADLKFMSLDILFCERCQSILSKPDLKNVLNCRICGYSCTFKKFPRVKEYLSQNRKEVTEEFYDCEEVFAEGEQSRPTVKFDCPECPSEKASYLAIQMRSVDEGQTIFYECVQCGHKTRIDS